METEIDRLCPCGTQLDESGHHVQCCAKHTRGAWLVGHNAVQAVWRQAGEKAGFTAWVNAAYGLPQEFNTTGRMCDLLYTPDHQNLRVLTLILADISLTRPFVENAVNREQRGTYPRKGLCQRTQMKRLTHALAESDHIVVPFVSDTLGSMTQESAVTLFLFSWFQAGQETEFFVEDWADGLVLTPATSRWWRRQSVLSADGMHA